MRNIKNQKGSVTLFVVITVLFFVIITIAVYVSNSNTRVSQMQEIARIKEVYEADLGNIDQIYEEREKGETPDNPNIKEYHNGVPIPKGFYYVGGEAETGLVISDHPDDEKVAVKAGQTGDITVPLKGNQFVWIPVKVEETDTETDIKAFKRTTTYDGTITDPGTSYSEPYKNITSADETGEKAEYAEMYKSVYKNKGFYVGRYEAGCETERTSGNKATAQGGTNPVLVQKDKYVYNYVPWGARMTSTAPASGVIGAVELSRGMYPKTSEEYGVASGLMYGVQWDAVMTFVNDAEHDVTNDSSSWGNYSDYPGSEQHGILQKTGINEKWKAKNMYDLAGNAYEWTNEAYNTNGRVYRGGRYNVNGSFLPASDRYGSYPDNTNYDYRTFRPMLYVKLNTV